MAFCIQTNLQQNYNYRKTDYNIMEAVDCRPLKPIFKGQN